MKQNQKKSKIKVHFEIIPKFKIKLKLLKTLSMNQFLTITSSYVRFRVPILENYDLKNGRYG